jgi:hypothetical protein
MSSLPMCDRPDSIAVTKERNKQSTPTTSPSKPAPGQGAGAGAGAGAGGDNTGKLQRERSSKGNMKREKSIKE